MEEKTINNIFYCCAPEDRDLCAELNKHLQPLTRLYPLSIWDDSKISPGEDREKKIQEKINTAHIILLLVSPDFMNSEECNALTQQAIERHRAGEAYVTLVILRPTDWRGAAFSNLPVLPKDAKPVTTWSNRDEAFLDVAKGIRKVIDEVNVKLGGTSRTIEAQEPPPSIRERVLQLLYEKCPDPSQAFDGENLAQLIGKRWYEIRSDVADLKKEGYIVTEQSQVGTRIFHRLHITDKGIDFCENGMPQSL